MNNRDWTVNPPLIYPDYTSTILRNPHQPLVPVPGNLSDLSMPAFGDSIMGEYDNDLTKNARVNGEPLGERMLVHGKVMDEQGRGIPNALVEIWQCNSAGRYIHKLDQHDAPLDPNFNGGGRALTDQEGKYHFYTIRPGAYPWGNHHNAWRPAHIHFSVFGHQFGQRLITQMYFPGDPLFDQDPIFNSVPAHARDLLIARFDLDATEPLFALGYEFNIVLCGSEQTPFE